MQLIGEGSQYLGKAVRIRIERVTEVHSFVMVNLSMVCKGFVNVYHPESEPVSTDAECHICDSCLLR